MPHYKAFEALCRSRLVATLVCVAVGRPGEDREPLEVPGCLLAGQDSGVFWVPDPAGVDWRVGGSTATRRDGPDDDLASLLEILSVPEVFDRAGQLAACVPGGVSNPGLRLAEAV